MLIFVKSMTKPSYEDVLRRVTQQDQRDGHQADVDRHYVVFPDGTRKLVLETRHGIRYVEDPEDPGKLIPETDLQKEYPTDDTGYPFDRIRHLGKCHFGHSVHIKRLFICRWCKKFSCFQHSILVKRRAYCRKRTCLVIGRTYQVGWFIFRAVRFCLKTVMGLSDESKQPTYGGMPPRDLEDELFDDLRQPEREDLSEAERR